MHGSHHHLPHLIEAFAPIIKHYDYSAVAFLIFIEDFGVPAPGETTLIAASFFAGTGHLNFPAVLLVGFGAAVMGDNIGFLIGSRGGRPLLDRYGKYIFLTPKRLKGLERLFNRHGGKIVMVARFIEGLRQFNGIIAGISSMRWHKFLLYNSIGAALWVTVGQRRLLRWPRYWSVA